MTATRKYAIDRLMFHVTSSAALRKIERRTGETRPADLPAAAGGADLLATLAARDGAIVPTLATDDDAPVALWRLVAERALCVNTTAAGGNASLMAMQG